MLLKVQYLGLLFNIYMCDIILEKQYECGCDFASYADVNTPYTDDADLNIAISKLEDCTTKLFK